MVDKISSLSVLTLLECKEIRSLVHALKKYWLKRNFFVPFYTLGAASYIDAVKNQQDYYRKAQQYNPILREHLEWLYKHLAETLEQFLKAPTSYKHSLALPGFHIYLACKLFEQSVASIHCDSQYKLVNWEFPEQTDFTKSISFTLAISLPNFGGGLNIWEVDAQEILELPRSEIQKLIESRAKRFYSYQVGQLIIHSGETIHQASIGKNIQPDDERITLQGHGIFSQGSWQLYW